MKLALFKNPVFCQKCCQLSFAKGIAAIILFAIICCGAGSCSRKLQKFLPAQSDGKMDEQLDDASPEFRAGWADGCETGISSGGNTFYKSFYQSNKIDGYRMSGSQDYRDAWEFAFWYCFRSTYIRQKSSVWGSIFKGYR